jgi:hypothetical protein
MYNSFKEEIPYEKYLEFQVKWRKKALTLLKGDERMCLNINLYKSKGRKEGGFKVFMLIFCKLQRRWALNTSLQSSGTKAISYGELHGVRG